MNSSPRRGNYTEEDIKEASRALQVTRNEALQIVPSEKLQDKTEKTVFGETGNWNGDDVIEHLRTTRREDFLIRELIKFYLTEEAVDEAYIEALGEQWANHQFSLPY